MTSIEGASEEEIRRLERAAGVALPEPYRRYLETMGRQDDGSLNDDELAASAEDVARFYESGGAARVPDDCLAVGVGQMDIELGCIELAPPHRFWETAGRRKVTLWAASFDNYLHSRTFMRHCAHGHQHASILSVANRERKLARAEALARELGFERLPFSDEVTICYASADESFCANQHEGRGMLVWLATNQSAERLASLEERARASIDSSLKRTRA